MPNYSVSVISDDNVVIANESYKVGLTVEQFLKQKVHEFALTIKKETPK